MLARRRWRLDLYEKRFPAYTTVMEFIATATRTGTVREEDLWKFARYSRDKEFIFGGEIQQFLKELHDKAVDLQTLGMELQAATTDADRRALNTRKSDICKWFNEQFATNRKLF